MSLHGAAALGFTLLVAACGSERRAITGGDADAGRIALAKYDCGVCHRIPGVRAAHGRVGPPLDRFGRRIYIAGRFANDEATLARWIMDAPALEPRTAMPAVGVQEADARDMAAYLLSLR